MNASTHENLDRFMKAYHRVKCFWLAPGFSPKDSFAVTPFLDLGFICSEIVIKNAWEIGPHDLDAVAVVPGSELVIPPEHPKDAPVLETLKVQKDRLRGNRKEH